MVAAVPQHSFVSETGRDLCRVCEADAADASQGPIGCEAEDIVNPLAYVGLALTPTERSLGIESSAKAEVLFPNNAADLVEGWASRWESWRIQVESLLG
jgi:hypothetical protein